MSGPAGSGIGKWVPSTSALPYVVSFGNEPTATAPAQQVVVTQALDPNVDLSTLSLAGLTIPNGSGTSSITVPVPPGAFSPVTSVDEYAMTVDLRPSQSLLVGIDVKLNPASRVLVWTFTSLDPVTGEPFPLNLANGFLPPASGASVLYSVRPKAGLPTGTTISSQACVVFNTNSAINTNVWKNAIDNTPPASKVRPLPKTESKTSFNVYWSGLDVGSGVKSYRVYVSDNGGPFAVWQMNTSATQASYAGVVGHTYGFYSIATDLVGNVEEAKKEAEATTTVQTQSACATDVTPQVSITRGGYRFSHLTNSFVETVTLTNTGAALSNASLVLDNLSAGVTLSGEGGTTQCSTPLGSPWIAIAGGLASGKSVSLTLAFSDPTKAAIQYTTRVLSGAGKQ